MVADGIFPRTRSRAGLISRGRSHRRAVIEDHYFDLNNDSLMAAVILGQREAKLAVGRAMVILDRAPTIQTGQISAEKFPVMAPSDLSSGCLERPLSRVDPTKRGHRLFTADDPFQTSARDLLTPVQGVGSPNA